MDMYFQKGMNLETELNVMIRTRDANQKGWRTKFVGKNIFKFYNSKDIEVSK